jgi:hypothetical protein
VHTVRFIQWILCLSIALIWLLIESAALAGVGSYDSIHEVIGQTEQVLRKAALDSPQWHRRQNAIQRDVEDITFLLDRALKASQNLNDAARNDYAEQALRLLQRAVRRGHFDPKDIEPVLTVIRQLLPNVAA